MCSFAPGTLDLRCVRLEQEIEKAQRKMETTIISTKQQEWTSLGCEPVINTSAPWHIVLEDDVALPGETSRAKVHAEIDAALAGSTVLLYYLGTVGGKRWFGTHAYAVRSALVAKWLLFDAIPNSCPGAEDLQNDRTRQPIDWYFRKLCFGAPENRSLCGRHLVELPPMVLKGCGLKVTDPSSHGILLQWGIGSSMRFQGALQLPANCTAAPGLEGLPRVGHHAAPAPALLSNTTSIGAALSRTESP